MADAVAVSSRQSELRTILDSQRRAFRSGWEVSAAARIDRLDRLAGMLVDNEGRIADAVAEDFGCRSRDFSRYGEVASSLKLLRHSRRRLRSWMRPERRPLDFPVGLLGGKGWVRWVPKGVVGLISPWNYPVFLVLAPLIDVLAAGNRAMIKPSENSPMTSALLAELMAAAFDNAEIAVVQGGVATAKAFAQLPFDHLVYTGSTEVGRAVMAAASENLVPVTLELGGKCPAILGRSARFAQAVEHIALGKLINSGQMCMGVDFAWVPAERMDEFVAAVRTAVITLYPGLADNPDYASMINQDHLQRLLDMVAEARRDGARVVSLNTGDDDPLENDLRKLPPTLVVDPDDGLRLMREEIFGPVLPIKGYHSLDEVLAWHDAHPAPLALCYFGTDRKEQERIVSGSRSGGVTVNGVIAHGVMATLPFGGVGESGMGVLHGRDGFRTFSYPRAILEAPRTTLFALMGLRPPFGKRLQWMIRKDLRR